MYIMYFYLPIERSKDRGERIKQARIFLHVWFFDNQVEGINEKDKKTTIPSELFLLVKKM